VTLDEVIARHELRRAGAPPSRAKGVVLLIHGRGATAESMLPLADVLAMPDLCYLAPQAEGYTWYPQSFMAPTALNEPYLSRGWSAWLRSSRTCLQSAGTAALSSSA
jgi:phospholipase/carboxylesterase